jgi:hypothetical protein
MDFSSIGWEHLEAYSEYLLEEYKSLSSVRYGEGGTKCISSLISQRHMAKVLQERC